MKNFFIVLALAGGLVACDDAGDSVKINTDSIDKKLENFSEKVEEKAGEVWDSTKEKAKDLKNSAERRIDSARRNDRDTLDK